MEGSFDIVKKNETLEITLAGGLDAGNAPAVSDKLQQYKGQEITRMVFFAKNLDYIASAGIRVIVFAVQKILKPGSDAFFVGGQPDVLAVLKMTGIDDALVLQEKYEG